MTKKQRTAKLHAAATEFCKWSFGIDAAENYYMNDRRRARQFHEVARFFARQFGVLPESDTSFLNMPNEINRKYLVTDDIPAKYNRWLRRCG